MPMTCADPVFDRYCGGPCPSCVRAHGVPTGASGSAEPLAPRFQVVRSSPVRTAATLACPPLILFLPPHAWSEGTGSPRCTETTQPGSGGWTRCHLRVDC